MYDAASDTEKELEVASAGKLSKFLVNSKQNLHIHLLSRSVSCLFATCVSPIVVFTINTRLCTVNGVLSINMQLILKKVQFRSELNSEALIGGCGGAVLLSLKNPDHLQEDSSELICAFLRCANMNYQPSDLHPRILGLSTRESERPMQVSSDPQVYGLLDPLG